MKKIFSLLLICLCIISLTGCLENDYISNDGGITLTIGEEYLQYMDSDVPSFTFNYDGVLNTLAENQYSFYTSFCQNDDLVLSRTIASFLEHYKDDTTFIIEEEKSGTKTHLNIIENGTRVKQKINIDDGKKYYETAYIYLDNGLQLVMTYCRFLWNGEVIYRWRETKNIEMKLLYPLMVVSEDDNRKFIVTPLPFGIKMHVSGSGTANASKIMANDEYVNKTNVDEDNIYYTFDYDKDKEVEENKEFVTAYYQKYMNATKEDNYLLFSYNGYNFKVMLYDNYFSIRYMGKVS